MCSHDEKVNAHFAAVVVLMSDFFDLRKSLESPADVWSISTTRIVLLYCFGVCPIMHAPYQPPCFPHYHNKKLMLTHNVDTGKAALLYVLYLYCVDHLNVRKWPLMDT